MWTHFNNFPTNISQCISPKAHWLLTIHLLVWVWGSRFTGFEKCGKMALEDCDIVAYQCMMGDGEKDWRERKHLMRKCGLVGNV